MRRLLLLSLILLLTGMGLSSCASVGGVYASSRDTVKGWFGGEEEPRGGTVHAASGAPGEAAFASEEADVEAGLPETAPTEAMTPDNAMPAPAMEVAPLAAQEAGEMETAVDVEMTIAAVPEAAVDAALDPVETMPVPVVTTSPPRAVVKPVGAGHSRWSDTTIWW